MCGIVGLFLKDKSLEANLGQMLSEMLVTMTDRGPDSAGIAVYNAHQAGQVKITVQADDPQTDFDGLDKKLGAAIGASVQMDVRDTHAVLTMPQASLDSAMTELRQLEPVIRIMVSNHNSLRRKLRRENIRIETENDTEVAAAYLTWKLQTGSSLGEALESSLNDLDGFFTFVVGTKDGFGVVRDPIACKPAVMAETDSYVAFGSEYRALVNLPDIEKARVWEPEPATVYFWNH